MKQLPEFKTLEEEAAFWAENDSVDYWDEFEDVEFEIDIRKDLLHPHLIVLAGEIEPDFIASQQLRSISIEYMIRDEEHLVVIRDVPAYYSDKDRREYISETTANQIDHLLEMERMKRIQPTTMMHIPVFDLAAAD